MRLSISILAMLLMAGSAAAQTSLSSWSFGVDPYRARS